MNKYARNLGLGAAMLGATLALVSPANAAAPVVSYPENASGTCLGHYYSLSATFQYDPNTNKRRGTAGAFHGRDFTQVIHDFQIGATSSGGGALSVNKVVDSIAGSSSVSGKWGGSAKVTIYVRVYGSGTRCAWTIAG